MGDEFPKNTFKLLRNLKTGKVNPISRNAAEFDARFDSDAAWDNLPTSSRMMQQFLDMPPTVQVADSGFPIIPGYPNGYNPYA